MKHFLFAGLAALTLTACGNAAEAPTSIKESTAEVVSTAEKMMGTKTKAVLVYADWCGSCKVLDPAVKKVQSMGKIPGVEFVTLDYTDKNEANFYAQAEAAGVDVALQDYLGEKVKTGQLLFVDIDDAKVVGKATKDDAVASIISKAKDAVSAS